MDPFITDVAVPVISALIGGGLTMLGVKWTINAQRKENSENQRLAVKPLFYALHPMQDYDYKSAKDFFLQERGIANTRRAFGIIKNTDNGVLIIDKFVGERHEYIPANGNMVDKGMIINLYVDINPDDNLNVAQLHVRDVLNNKYIYDVSINSFGSDGHIEFSDYKEVK